MASENGHVAKIAAVDCPITECYAEVEIVRCPVAYGLTTIDGVTMTIPFGPSAETIEQYPSIVGNLTYTGSAQSPQWADYDSSKMSIGGTQSGTNAGSYTTTFTPLDGYVWPDGSADAYSVTWSIAKAAGSVTLSKTSVSVGVNATTTFTVTRSGDGAISVSSSAAGTARATLSGTTVSVTGVKTGSATITVSVSEGTNHLAASATCAATVAPNYRVEIKSANLGQHNTSYAYFQINGTKYNGGTATNLTVVGGTEYTAYASIKNANNTNVGSVILDGATVKTGGSYKGTVSSDMTVLVGCHRETTYNVYYATVEITTS